MLAGLTTYTSLYRSQWLDRARLQQLQSEKLQRLIHHAYTHVPYYREKFDAAGAKPEDIRSVEALTAIPITSRAELQEIGPARITSDAFVSSALVSETTSGSTGRPFFLRFDAHFVRVRNALFLRALMSAGYRPGQKLMLVTDSRGKASRRWMRWYYSSLEDSPRNLVARMNTLKPHVLYGCVTPLRQMALHLQAAAAPRHRPRRRFPEFLRQRRRQRLFSMMRPRHFSRCPVPRSD